MENQETELPSDQVVASEVAEAEFERFVDAMDLDVTAKMDPEDAKAFAATKRIITRAIEKGRLIIDDVGQPIYTPQASDDKTPITFLEPKGASLLAMESRKKGEDISRLFASIANMTRQTPVRFAKMANRDLRVCMAISTLFLT